MFLSNFCCFLLLPLPIFQHLEISLLCPISISVPVRVSLMIRLDFWGCDSSTSFYFCSIIWIVCVFACEKHMGILFILFTIHSYMYQYWRSSHRLTFGWCKQNTNTHMHIILIRIQNKYRNYCTLRTDGTVSFCQKSHARPLLVLSLEEESTGKGWNDTNQL